jgi:transposase
MQNRRRKVIVHNGQTLTFEQAAKIAGLRESTVRARVYGWWTDEEIMLTPQDKRSSKFAKVK